MMISAGKIKSMVSLMREEETSVLFHFNLQTDEEPNNIPGLWRKQEEYHVNLGQKSRHAGMWVC